MSITEQDFTTPDRSSSSSMAAVAAAAASGHGHHHLTGSMTDDLVLMNGKTITNERRSRSAGLTAAVVTPPDSFSAAVANRKENAGRISKKMHTSVPAMQQEDDNKQVRFDKNNNSNNNDNNNHNHEVEGATISQQQQICSVGSDEGESTSSSSSSSSPASTSSQRGLISRRGGRCANTSPSGRLLLPPPSVGATFMPSKEAVEAAALLEFKSFRSSERKYKDETGRNINKRDDLCTINERRKGGETVPSLCKYDNDKKKTARNTYQSSGLPTSAEAASTHPSSKKNNNVTFSPVQVPKISGDKKYMKTPTRSPANGRFTSLPTLDDDTLVSPGAIFLSPSHTPTYFHIDSKSKMTATTADVKDRNTNSSKYGLAAISSSIDSGSHSRALLTPRTPKQPAVASAASAAAADQLDRDRLLTTPTDFAFDYGKTGTPGSLVDSSNVLAWLHSPSANGLFSPGGLGSMLNTPRAICTGSALKIPHTPTYSSTSFFFSDVAGLPREGDCASPAKSEPNTTGAGNGGPTVTSNAAENRRNATHNGRVNNIICISPLSSYRSKHGSLGPNSPKINYKDMFASPAERSGMAMLGRKVPGVGGIEGVPRGGSLDAVHLAERDLMEDEDLSVLLQLASSTPRPTAVISGAGVAVSSNSTSDGTKVFRSSSKEGRDEKNLPSLQLPSIGGQDGAAKGTRLTRKPHSQDQYDACDERGTRPYFQASNSAALGINGNQFRGPENNSKHSRASTSGIQPPTTGSLPHQAQRSLYPMSSHFPPPHHDAPYYHSMHPGMAPHGGSMRVIVGGPPPQRGGKSAGDSQRVRTYTIGPRGDYPPPPYPPPPSHYPHHHGHPPPTHMHPHYSSYPPPPPPPPSRGHAASRHIPVYGSAPKGKLPKSKPVKKQSTVKANVKSGIKRQANAPAVKASPAAKKAKKSGSQGPTKKKNRSPQLVDKAERQKAAANIQAVNQASGGKNDKAAALAAAILRGVTMRPSGKWQAQLYFAGKSRYIGVFDSREKAALAYEIAREKLKSEKSKEGGVLSPKKTEAAVSAARKAAFEGVNERDPRLPK